MKKVFAIFLMAVLVLSLSVSVFANSPQGTPSYKIYHVNGQGAKVDVITIKDGESISYKADSAKGDFDDWAIYKIDGKTPAVLGADYTLAEGQSLTDESITLFPKASLIVVGNYNGVDTTFKVGQNGEVTSPQTGDVVTVCLSAVMLLSLAGMIVVKKRAA